MMNTLIEAGALGVATVLIFFYGAAQRHLRKVVASQVEGYRVQTAAAEVRHEERLEVLRAQIAEAEQKLADNKKQAAEIEAAIAASQKKAAEVRAYLETADGKAERLAALKDLEAYKLELAQIKSTNRVIKSGAVISQVSYHAKIRCADTYRTLMLDCVEFWRNQPGRPLRIADRRGLVWVGSNVESLQSHIKAYDTWVWNEPGQCTLSVA